MIPLALPSLRHHRQNKAIVMQSQPTIAFRNLLFNQSHSRPAIASQPPRVWLGPVGLHVAHRKSAASTPHRYTVANIASQSSFHCSPTPLRSSSPLVPQRFCFLRALSRLRPFNHSQSFRFLQQPNTPSAFTVSVPRHRAPHTTLLTTFSDSFLRQKVPFPFHTAFLIDKVGPRHRYQKRIWLFSFSFFFLWAPSMRAAKNG